METQALGGVKYFAIFTNFETVSEIWNVTRLYEHIDRITRLTFKYK
jgi:hypothetical protein